MKGMPIIFTIAIISLAPFFSDAQEIVSCTDTLGFNQFNNGDREVVIEVVNGQLVITENRFREIKSDTIHFPVCLSSGLIVEVANGTDIFSAATKFEQSFLTTIVLSRLFAFEDSELWKLGVADPNYMYPVYVELESYKGVLSVQPDFLVKTNNKRVKQNRDKWFHKKSLQYDSDTNATLFNRLGLPKLWQFNKGEGVKVAVIDNHFDMQHPDLSAKRHEYYSIGLPNVRKRAHGLEVAGIVFAGHNGRDAIGVAPEATLVAIDLNDTFTSNIVSSLSIAYQRQADIINMSWYLDYLMHPIRKTLQHIYDHGRGGRGTLMVAASGNRYRVTPYEKSLSGSGAVLTVAPTDHIGQTSDHVSGDFIDISAPSFLHTLGKDKKDHSRVTTVLGASSSAAPLVSGIASLLLSYCPTLKASQLRALLIESADAPSEDLKPYLGAGVVNPESAISLLQINAKRYGCTKIAPTQNLQ